MLSAGKRSQRANREDPDVSQHFRTAIKISAAGDISEVLYTWLVSPEEEQLVCDALVHLGPVETEQGLHAEGVRTIQEVLHCTLDDARATLRELRVRNRIRETTAPLDHLDQPHFRWERPSA